MKIVNIETIILLIPLKNPVQTSFGKMSNRKHTLIKIETDEGITGWGGTWTNYPEWAAEERKLTIEKGIKPLLEGENPLNITYLWDEMYNSLINSGAGKQWGAKGPLFQAISGVDIALWDILGKKFNLPVYQLLGGSSQSKIKAYASGLGPDNFEEYVEDSLHKGYKAFKLKVGFGKELDLYNLKTIRSLIGDENQLMIDANQAWRDADEAIDYLKVYQKFNILFVEEPVPVYQIGDLKRIKKSKIIPVAGGENGYSRYDFKVFLEEDILDIYQPDITKTGGISEAQLIAKMVSAWYKNIVPHMFGTGVGQAASINLFTSLANGLMMEVDVNPNPLLNELLEDKFYSFERGYFIIEKAKPGLGIDLNWDLIRKYRI